MNVLHLKHTNQKSKIIKSLCKLAVLIVFILFSATVTSQNKLIDEQLAAEYFLNGKYEEAAELYARLYEKTANPSYYHSLLKSYIELKEFKKAERLIDKRLKQNQTDLTLYVDLGKVYLANNNKSKAQKEFRTAIGSISFNASVVESLANAFIDINEISYAIETYEAGQKLFKNKQSFAFELFSLYEQTGANDKMVNECLDLIESSPTSLNQLQLFLQPYFTGSNKTIIETLRKILIKRAQNSPNNKSYASLLLWFFVQEKDFEFALNQAIAIDKRFPNENGSTVFQVGEICLSNDQYAIAANAFEHLIKKGPENPLYVQSQINFLNAKYLRITRGLIIDQKDLEELSKHYNEALLTYGKNAQTMPLMKNLAHLEAFYMNNIQTAADILFDAKETPNINRLQLAEIKLELADILLFGRDVWEASLLYMQVEKDFKNDILGSIAKFDNARLSYYIGEFEWAKTQLEVLRASTSKLIANDAMELSLLISDNMDDDSTYGALTYYAKADLLSYRNQDDSALILLDSIGIYYLNHPIFDEVLFKKANIKIKQGKYLLADSLLQKLIVFYPNDILADDALFMLGELNEIQFKQPQKASTYYEQIILDHPASVYVTEARKRYRAIQSKNS